jgi:hypothetical protein
MARASDAQRARFVRTLTGRDWCDATSYDVCLNTGTTPLARVVDIIWDLLSGAPPETQLPPLTPRDEPASGTGIPS